MGKIKGIDDLIHATTDKFALKKNIENYINNGVESKELTIIDITEYSEDDLKKIWCLDDAHEFAKKHKEALSKLNYFYIGQFAWKFDKEGNIKPLHDISPGEYFYMIVKKELTESGEKETYKFIYDGLYKFLANRGFYLYTKPNNERIFIRIVDNVIYEIDHIYIRKFMIEFVRNMRKFWLLEAMYTGAKLYFGPDSLLNLPEKQIQLQTGDFRNQDFYFKNKMVMISKDSIIEENLSHASYAVWKEMILDRDFKIIPNFMEVVDNGGAYSIDFGVDPETGKPYNQLSNFIQFIFDTCNFAWQKPDYLITDDDNDECIMHMISKITAIGYLICEANNPSEAKAIICMDGKLSEVGESNGRSGKSIFAKAVGMFVNQVMINGKKGNQLFNDDFAWEEINEKTRCVWIDDITRNFNFEMMFPLITEKWTINAKHTKKLTLKRLPKVIITTNHAIDGNTGSFEDRQFVLAFSDYYNSNRKPIQKFGTHFFSDDWDYSQWLYFQNFMVYCCQTYLKYGLIAAPKYRTEIRKLRQFIGESFLDWADTFFSDKHQLGVDQNKKDLFESYLNSLKSSSERNFQNIRIFKKKMKAWCQYHGYQFNPYALNEQGLPDPGNDIKKNGVEYFHIVKPQ